MRQGALTTFRRHSPVALARSRRIWRPSFFPIDIKTERRRRNGDSHHQFTARRQPMNLSPITRRTLLQGGGAALAGVSVLRIAGPTAAFQTPVTGQVIPWLDQLEPNPVPEVIVQQLDWEQLNADSWITPQDQFFVIKHFNLPELTETDWRLAISGLVDQPMTLTLDEVKARERQEVTFTIECSG